MKDPNNEDASAAQRKMAIKTEKNLFPKGMELVRRNEGIEKLS